MDGVFLCFTLEDVLRAPGVKLKHQTAIPAGTYEVVLTFSNRFQQIMPLLVNVPLFEGIRIHPGNTAADTSGCILVGRQRQENKILQSRSAYAELFNALRTACAKGKVFIEIRNPSGWAAQFAPQAPAPAVPPAPLPVTPATATKPEAALPKLPAAAIPTNWSVSAPALVSAKTARPPAGSTFRLAFRLLPRTFPLISTVLTAAVNFFQFYKWPLLCAAALLFGFWLGWHTRPPERKSL